MFIQCDAFFRDDIIYNPTVNHLAREHLNEFVQMFEMTTGVSIDKDDDMRNFACDIAGKISTYSITFPFICVIHPCYYFSKL